MKQLGDLSKQHCLVAFWKLKKNFWI